MKKLVVLCGENCGYCKKAKMLINRALDKKPEYVSLDFEFVDENSPQGKKYQHTLVPAFFCDGRLLFEGNPNMEAVIMALKSCYE